MAFSSVVIFLPDDSLELFDQPGDLTAAAVLRQYPYHQLQLHVGARRVAVPSDKILEPGSTYHVVPLSSAGAAASAGEGRLRPRTPTEIGGGTVSAASSGGGGGSADSESCIFRPLQNGDTDRHQMRDEDEEDDSVPPLHAKRGGDSGNDDARAGMAATAAAMMLTGRAGGAGIQQRDGFLRLMAEIHDGCQGAELDLGPPVLRSNRKPRSNQPSGDSSSTAADPQRAEAHCRSAAAAAAQRGEHGGGEGYPGQNYEDEEGDMLDSEDGPRRPRMSEEFISVPNTCMTDPDMSGGEKKKRTLAAELADMSMTMTNVMVQARTLRGDVV